MFTNRAAMGSRAARALRRALFSDEVIDDLLGRVEDGGLSLTGPGGFLPELVKSVLERGMQAELTDHLGYDKGDPAGRGSGNSRNGTSPKTVACEVGAVRLDQPRDRAGSFASALVPKGARRLGGLDEQIVSLYAGGMTVRDIGHHFERTLGVELSHGTISKITDAVVEKVRDGAHVSNRSAHIAVGVDLKGVTGVIEGVHRAAALPAQRPGVVQAEHCAGRPPRPPLTHSMIDQGACLLVCVRGRSCR